MLTVRSRRIVWVATALLLGFACWLIGGWGGPRTIAAVSNLGSLTFTLFAFSCAVAAAHTTTGHPRVNWTALAVGLSGWIVADLTWTYYTFVLHTHPPYPSFVDAGYLLLPVSVSLAWAFSAPVGSRLAGIRPLLDGLIVAGTLFVICWVLVLKDLFTAAHSPLATAVTLAYPTTDLVIITVGLVVISSIPAGLRRTLGMVVIGLIIMAIADSVLVYLHIHGTMSSIAVVIGWSIGLLFIGVGAITGIGQPELLPAKYRELSPKTQWLPLVLLPAAAVVGVAELWHTTDRPVLVTGVALLAVALIRQATVLIDNRQLTTTVAEQALRDPLTGLANRLLFSDRIAHAMHLRKRDGREVAVLSLDLDDFKLVNDNLGHPCGDALLKAVADRLLNVLPTGDAVARLGGDEFAMLIEAASEPPCDLAQRVVEVFDKPFFLDGEEVFIHPSIGLATASSAMGRELSADELSQRAELAMHTAKRVGIGGVHTYTNDTRNNDRTGLRMSAPDNGTHASAPPVAAIQLLGQLRRAIEERELALVYQPKISLSTDTIVGVEALIRWPHPDFGLLTPNQFLPLVRQNGLMGAVTDLVLAKAVEDAAGWYALDTCEVPVAINLFAPALDDLTLPDRISAALAKAGLPPAALSFELTEHLLLANIRRAKSVIDQLRAKGLRIAIDDFGSGYATMSYLRELPIDELKLDRQFIAPILRSERSAAIVEAVIDLAHALGIACVAEGVEDKATADRLREYGCDIAQGHYFSRPISAAELEVWCRDGCRCPAIFT